ncbi:hypothetical protein AQUCO_00700562v1 [Aquilegia coerulea]|uniref:Peptidase A1 domain-containing protein n=1 Tax=Aquilegia coerulea TaxID=218851 RepID=A0A2G5EKM0_AQUCA|nr:hypothetical protein AQUCO_00700562v1 [Aquilegia coerulea]
MASTLQILIFSVIFFCFNPFTSAQPSFRPRALVLFITKDASTLQYLTTVNQRTPLASINVVVDLGGQFLWVDCDQFYQSSSYVPARCGSAQCNLAGSKACGTSTPPLLQDVFAIQSTNGKNPGPIVSIPRLLFTCGSTFLLEGLASGVQGMAGLGRARIGLPSQFASAFSFNRKFATWLPSSISANGVIFFGNTPYTMMPNIDISSSLMYTPLLINPVSTASSYTQGDRSTEYFIRVKSIKINAKSISLNTTLLSIQSNGYGGTKISTVNPYTVLETSIYNALTEAFLREANLPRVASVAPLEFCFDSANVASTRLGPGVPSIDLVLQSESVVWRITGSNSMVQVRDNVLCLGFIDGGSNPRTSIVLGGHQLEDNLIQFDLAASRLGFSSSLLGRQTTCSNFNFTSNA